MEEKFATELLREIKSHSKRWFIAFIIMTVLEAVTIGCFIWYISLPVEVESVDITNDDGITSYVGEDMNGEINLWEESQ